MRRNLARHLGYAAIAAGLVACSSTDLPGDPVIPPAGAAWLSVQLATPRTDDGAVQLHITGPAIDSAAVAGYEGFATVTNGAADLIVTGPITSGTIARIRVADASRIAEYRGTVVAAATRATYVTRDVSTYRVTLTR